MQIDYEQLVADYMQSLTTVLRGFRSGLKHGFLETWVHDEDETRSILGIIEAARDSGLAAISIRLGAFTLKKIDLARLKDLAGHEGKVRAETKGDGLDFGVAFGNADAHAPTEHKPDVAHFGARAVKPKADVAAPSPAKSRDAGGAMNPLYARALQRAAQFREHEGELQPENGLVLARASQDGCALTALVEPVKHVVRKVAYRGAAADAQRGLLEHLCGLMLNKPILECADHAIIFLEFELRDRSQPPPVAGIVTPENADPMFALPAAMIRNLLADYREKTGFKGVENFFGQPVHAKWKALTQEERQRRIQAALAEHPAGDGVTVVAMETPKRVVVGFREGPGNAEKQSRLMRLEEHLQQTLEPTLQLYVEPKVDQNKQRRIREASAL